MVATQRRALLFAIFLLEVFGPMFRFELEILETLAPLLAVLEIVIQSLLMALLY